MKDELLKQWAEEFDRQNALLVESGEEPLTVEEFVSCRVDDVRDARAEQRAEYKREWWKTYRAALTGLHAYSDNEGGRSTDNCHSRAVKAANLAHGPLEVRS